MEKKSRMPLKHGNRIWGARNTLITKHALKVVNLSDTICQVQAVQPLKPIYM